MKMIGGDRKLMNVVFNLDVIVFQELLSEEQQQKHWKY